MPSQVSKIGLTNRFDTLNLTRRPNVVVAIVHQDEEKWDHRDDTPVDADCRRHQGSHAVEEDLQNAMFSQLRKYTAAL